jgi:hypothetical protein
MRHFLHTLKHITDLVVLETPSLHFSSCSSHHLSLRRGWKELNRRQEFVCHQAYTIDSGKRVPSFSCLSSLLRIKKTVISTQPWPNTEPISHTVKLQISEKFPKVAFCEISNCKKNYRTAQTARKIILIQKCSVFALFTLILGQERRGDCTSGKVRWSKMGLYRDMIQNVFLNRLCFIWQ